MNAIERVRQYVKAREEHPISNMGDAIHSVHLGTDREGELRLSDLQEVLRRLDGPKTLQPNDLEKKVAAFAMLPDGWNSYGAKAFPKETITLAMEMARKLGDEWKTVPCGDGSIEFYRSNEDEMVFVSTTFDEEPSLPSKQ